MSMTRADHMKWAKARALEYIAQGDMPGAFASFQSDLWKHPETKGAGELNMTLGAQLLMNGHLKTAEQMRDWIEGMA